MHDDGNTDDHGDFETQAAGEHQVQVVAKIDKVDGEAGATEDTNATSQDVVPVAESKNVHTAGRIMERFSDFILIPWVKAVIILIFVAFFAVSMWSTTLLKISFDFRSVLPSDSYVIDFFNVLAGGSCP